MDNPKVKKLATLLEETKRAHHQAFLEVDGADPEWPIWYADRLHEALSQLLGPQLTRSQIVYELIRLAQESDAEGEPWPVAYARDLVGKYS